MQEKIPMALQAPKGDLNIITNEMIDEAIQLSRKSPRKRIILPFHKKESDTLHRMFNIIQPMSYIRPHHHAKSEKSESIIVLRGGICYITFNQKGEIVSHNKLNAGSNYFGVDTEPNVYHSFYALKEDTVIYEVKPGPYVKELDKDFAPWSPEEGTNEAIEYLNKLIETTT